MMARELIIRSREEPLSSAEQRPILEFETLRNLADWLEANRTEAQNDTKPS